MQPKDAQARRELAKAFVDLQTEKGRRVPFCVVGDSMAPTMAEVRVVAVESAPEALRRGDILMFPLGPELAVHRLLSRGRRPDGSPYLRARGDGNPRLDPPVDPEDVVARVLAVLRDEGWRDLRCRRARAYAVALALHDRFWGVVAALAERIDRGLGRGHSRVRLHAAVFALDRALLRATHALLFRACHPRIPPPEGVVLLAGDGR